MISPRQISKHGPTYSEFEKIVILKYISKGLYFFFFSDQTWYDGQTVALRFNWGGKHIGAAGGGILDWNVTPRLFAIKEE